MTGEFKASHSRHGLVGDYQIVQSRVGAEGGKGLDTQDLRYFDPSWTKEERKLIPNRRLNHEKFTKALTDKDISHYPFRHGIDFYHQWESDLDLFQELGLRIFRTSVCWARIYPNGDDEKPNEEGLRYYHDLFQGCHDRGIKVFVTILHYNIPLNLLQKYGGWRSRETIKYYEKYARTLFQYLGDVVDYWLPFNEFNAGKFRIEDSSLIVPLSDNVAFADN